jgi:hypothetical protein
MLVGMPGGVGVVATWGAPTAGGSMHDEWNEESAYWQLQGMLTLTARASEDLYGVFAFEMNSYAWGEGANGANSIGTWGTDQAAVEVKNVFIDFRVPPKLPVWLRVGTQTFLIRPVWFLARDGAGITGRVMIDPIKLMIRPMWAHQVEGSVWRADERDFYALDMSLPIGPVSVGGFFLVDTNREVTANLSDACTVWWLGAYANGKLGPVNFMFDFAYDNGEWERPAPLQDVNFNGWGLRGTFDVNLGMFNVGLGGLYYSGGDARDWIQDPTDRDYEWFIRPSSEATGTLMDSVIFGGMWSFHGPGIGHMNQPFQWTQSIWGAPAGYTAYMAGMWGIRGFASVQPLDWLKIFFQVAYWGDATDNGDTYGSEYDPVTGWYEDNDDMGTEIDVGAHINIYKNLVLKTAFGYLFAGDALDQWNTAQALNEDPSDPWAWHSALIYTF